MHLDQCQKLLFEDENVIEGLSTILHKMHRNDWATIHREQWLLVEEVLDPTFNKLENRVDRATTAQKPELKQLVICLLS